MMEIDNPTKLQKDILKVSKGYSKAEIIHAFEVIKIHILIKE